MARCYDVRTVALTLGVSSKWVDNLLSHHRVFGVSGGRQGVQRSVSPDGLLAIELTRQLAQELELPVHRAAALASDIVANRTRLPSAPETRIDVAVGIQLAANLSTIEVSLRDRLLAAVEATAQRRRGRPRARPAVS